MIFDGYCFKNSYVKKFFKNSSKQAQITDKATFFILFHNSYFFNHLRYPLFNAGQWSVFITLIKIKLSTISFISQGLVVEGLILIRLCHYNWQFYLFFLPLNSSFGHACTSQGFAVWRCFPCGELENNLINGSLHMYQSLHFF